MTWDHRRRQYFSIDPNRRKWKTNKHFDHKMKFTAICIDANCLQMCILFTWYVKRIKTNLVGTQNMRSVCSFQMLDFMFLIYGLANLSKTKPFLIWILFAYFECVIWYVIFKRQIDIFVFELPLLRFLFNSQFYTVSFERDKAIGIQQ